MPDIVTLTINPVNDAPIANNQGNVSTYADISGAPASEADKPAGG